MQIPIPKSEVSSKVVYRGTSRKREPLNRTRFMYQGNRPFSYSTKEPGSSDIFIQFYTRGSIEWR